MNAIGDACKIAKRWQNMYKYNTQSNSFNFHIGIGNGVSKAFYIQENMLNQINTNTNEIQ